MKYYVRVEILNEGEDTIWTDHREFRATDSSNHVRMAIATLMRSAWDILKDRLT